jgi:FAD/FMN-containing dehydrogenase
MAVSPYGPLSAIAPRAQLGESIRALSQTLRMPDMASVRQQLRGLLDPLRAAFAEHRAATEGTDGIYAEVVYDAPRLANTVHGLVAEHAALDSAMAALARRADEVSADAEALRRHAYKVLDELSRHRQHDADLVYEAYATDIGGE